MNETVEFHCSNFNLLGIGRRISSSRSEITSGNVTF